jgi:hypothetical protein
VDVDAKMVLVKISMTLSLEADPLSTNDPAFFEDFDNIKRAIGSANCTKIVVDIHDFDATVSPQGFGDPVSRTLEGGVTNAIVWTLEDTVKSRVEESASSLIQAQINQLQAMFRSEGPAGPSPTENSGSVPVRDDLERWKEMARAACLAKASAIATRPKSKVYDELYTGVGLEIPKMSRFDFDSYGEREDDFNDIASPFWNLRAITQGFFAQVPEPGHRSDDIYRDIIGENDRNATILFLFFGANTMRTDQLGKLFRPAFESDSESVLESFFNPGDPALELEEVRTGQCSAEDAVLWENADVRGDLEACGTQCYGAAECTSACAKEREGISTECSLCVGELSSCIVSSCLAQCVAGIDECIVCAEESGCDVGFEECAGFALFPAPPLSESEDETNPNQVAEVGTNTTAKVHRGILRRWLMVKDKVQAKFQNMLSFAKPGQRVRLYVAGHGLGGAFSLMSALDISLLKMPRNTTVDVSVFAFGTPMFSNDVFARAIDEKVSQHIVYHSVHDGKQVEQLSRILEGYTPLKNTVQILFNASYATNVPTATEEGASFMIDPPETYSTLLRLESAQLIPNEVLAVLFESGGEVAQEQSHLLCSSLLET